MVLTAYNAWMGYGVYRMFGFSVTVTLLLISLPALGVGATIAAMNHRFPRSIALGYTIVLHLISLFLFLIATGFSGGVFPVWLPYAGVTTGLVAVATAILLCPQTRQDVQPPGSS